MKNRGKISPVCAAGEVSQIKHRVNNKHRLRTQESLGAGWAPAVRPRGTLDKAHQLVQKHPSEQEIQSYYWVQSGLSGSHLSWSPVLWQHEENKAAGVCKAQSCSLKALLFLT